MAHRLTGPPGAELPEALPEPVAARLLARASELDAALASDVPVAELRAAAVEAGISERAFEAALGEVHRAGPEPVAGPRPVRRLRAWLLAATTAVLLISGAFAVATVHTRPAAEPQAGALMVDEAILLRCLSPGEAAALVRPVLHLRANTIVINPTHAPRILSIHALPAQLQEVRALLDPYERAGSAACGSSPAAAEAR